MSESSSRPRPAGSRVGGGEIETTLSEKVLAVVLAVFIAIGAIWAYVKLDEVGKDSQVSYVPDRKLIGPEGASAIDAHRQAEHAVWARKSERRNVTRELEFRREAYRTALDADRPAADLETQYEAARARLASVSKELEAAAAVEARTGSAAKQAEAQLREERRDAAEREKADRAHHDRVVFFLRLGFLVLMLAGAYRLLGRLRSRHSRYLPAALAWVGASAIVAIVMAADYTNSYIEFDEVGPLAISVAGVVLTLIAFVALQRFLAKAVPARRVRRNECPFCGFPLRDKPHCEGCGRTVIASCASCHEDRRVGTPRCACCGNA